MDAPAMVTRKHVPEDVGLRNIAADEEGGQQQLHRDDKEHKPVLKKVKEKVKKIKSTIAGHGNNGGDDHGDERGGGGSSSSSDEDEGKMEQREAAMEKGGYQEDVEDKPVVSESDPEVHGAPMYDSVGIPDVQEVEGDDAPRVRFGDLGGPVIEDPAVQEVEGDDAPRVRFGDLGGPVIEDPAVQEVEGDDAPRVRFGDLGGPVVEDPAAPRSTTPAARGGEDIGTTPVVRAFESMTVSDDPPHVGAGKRDVDQHHKDAMPVSDAGGEEWKEAATDPTTDGSASGATYTDKIKAAAAGTLEYGKKLATTVYEKAPSIGTAVGKVQQATQSAGTATPGVGAQGTVQTGSTETVTPGTGGPGNGQDKGVTGYIAEMLRPGDEDRALSEAISGAVQQRKEEVGRTVAQRVPAPGPAVARAREAPAQAMSRAREAVTSLTGGNRVSETVQPTTEGNVKEGVAVEGPVLRGEEIGGAKTNMSIM